MNCNVYSKLLFIAVEKAKQNEVYQAVYIQSPLVHEPEVESYLIWFDGLSPVDPTVIISTNISQGEGNSCLLI